MKAEILICRKDRGGDGTPIPEYLQSTNAGLVIDGKRICISSSLDGSEKGEKRLLSEVEFIARQYGDEMAKRGVSDYHITNGERIRFTTKERVSAMRIPDKALQLFERTLCRCLYYDFDDRISQ